MDVKCRLLDEVLRRLKDEDKATKYICRSRLTEIRGRAARVKIFSNLSQFVFKVVGVAQLVEPRIVIPVVVGSIPIVHPIISYFAILFPCVYRVLFVLV